ncbi:MULTISPECIES: tetratricopeptide repeat protein [Clostridium]|uniref:tetratricopeptide repeat protein n=1 Tax=Clostridium TaxID=1485 RepID=UPI000826AC16|nr:MULTISPECIES: tetratricopeptide repeat protein [Clostridium]PJI09398.1 hypothetical protein CUB90_16580 [Clostridium sp. CT7]
MENINDNNKQAKNIEKRMIFLYDADKDELAIKEAEKLLEYKPNNYKALMIIAISYEYMRQYDRAASAALELLRVYPESSLAYGICGHIFLNKGEYKKTIDYCKKSMELDPYDAFFGYYTMSFALSEIGGRANLCEAANLIDKALEIEPDNVEFHVAACGIYMDIGEYHKAKEEGEKALQINPNSAKAHLNYGSLLVYFGYLNESLEHSYMSLQLDPDEKHERAQKNIDAAKGFLQEPQKYYDYLEKIFFDRDSKYENSSECFALLVGIFIRDKKYLNALKVLKRYLKIKPNAVDEHIKYAKMLYDEGALVEVLDYIKELKKINPKEEKLDEYIKNISNEM